MGDARDTAKKKKADEKKGAKSKPAANWPPPPRPRPRRSRPRSNGLPATGLTARIWSRVALWSAAASAPACFVPVEAASPRINDAFHAPPRCDLGSALGTETSLSRLEASGRELHGERVRRHGVLLIRELTGQGQRRPRQFHRGPRTSRARPSTRACAGTTRADG